MRQAKESPSIIVYHSSPAQWPYQALYAIRSDLAYSGLVAMHISALLYLKETSEPKGKRFRTSEGPSTTPLGSLIPHKLLYMCMGLVVTLKTYLSISVGIALIGSYHFNIWHIFMYFKRE